MLNAPNAFFYLILTPHGIDGMDVPSSISPWRTRHTRRTEMGFIIPIPERNLAWTYTNITYFLKREIVTDT